MNQFKTMCNDTGAPGLDHCLNNLHFFTRCCVRYSRTPVLHILGAQRRRRRQARRARAGCRRGHAGAVRREYRVDAPGRGQAAPAGTTQPEPPPLTTSRAAPRDTGRAAPSRQPEPPSLGRTTRGTGTALSARACGLLPFIACRFAVRVSCASCVNAVGVLIPGSFSK